MPEDLIRRPGQALVEGDAQLVLNALLVAPGKARLDLAELRFERADGLSGRLGPADGLCISLSDIVEASLDGGVFSFATADGAHHRMRGGVVPQIAATLRAMIIADPGSESVACAAPVACTLMQGPLGRAGHLVVCAAGISFAPAGAVDLSVGEWPLWLPVESILGFEGDVERVLVTHAAGVLELKKIDDAQAIVNLASVLRPRAGAVSLEPWGSPALLVKADGVHARGRLTLRSKSEVVFVPLAASETEGLLESASKSRCESLGTLQGVRVVGEHGGVRHLTGGQRRWRAQLLQEPDAIGVLEDTVGRLAPGLPPGGERVPVGPLTLGLQAVRVVDTRGNSRTLRPAAVVAGEHTLDLIVQDTPEARGVAGVQLRIELQSIPRRWVWLSHPWRVRPVGRDELQVGDIVALKGAGDLVRVQLPWPTAAQVEGVANRRSSVRVALDDESVEIDFDGRRWPARIQSLSSGGGAVWLQHRVQIGQVVGLALGLPDMTHPLPAELVWARPFADGHLVGVRFLDTSDGFVSELQALVSQLELFVARGEVAPLRAFTERALRDAARLAAVRSG
jgi:hypothetical protein